MPARDGIGTAEGEDDMVTADLLTAVSANLDRQPNFLEAHLR